MASRGLLYDFIDKLFAVPTRRFAILARVFTSKPCAGNNTAEVFTRYISMLLYEPWSIAMYHNGISLFANGAFFIRYEWLLKPERDRFLQLFLHRTSLFKRIETFVGDSFCLSEPFSPPPLAGEKGDLWSRAHDPDAWRRVLVRDSLVYILRTNDQLRFDLLRALQSIIITSGKRVDTLLFDAEYALQQNMNFNELLL